MENITADRNEVMATLENNRDAHLAIFEEALKGYKTEVMKQLQEHLAKVESSKMYPVSIHIPVPENHIRDYDRAITMLGLSVEPTIVLSEKDVQCYVMDDWAWKRQFLTTNSSYSAAATQALGDD